MYRLGLRLTIAGGREAFTRLLLTIVAVAIGATVLLTVFADFHAYQTTSNRPAWEATSGIPVNSTSLQDKNGLLWNYSENIFKGQFIEQLNVAALGKNTLMPPGVSRLPAAGQFYASPALASLLKTVPKDELGNRFPGTQVGTIGQTALSFPTELAIYVGYSPAQLAHLPNTVVVDKIANKAQLQGTTNMYKMAFGIGAIVILFPLLILINTATRLSAARREERYAAMRLVGATPRQIAIIASVDATVGSFIGVLVGIAIFLAVRPAIAGISFSGTKFFANYVNPTVWGYIGLLIGVPVVAAIASLIVLRRVRISPLGVSRKSTAAKPGVWRIIPLVIGAPVFVIAAFHVSDNLNSSRPLPFVLIGLLLTMIGLALGGSWLTMQATILLARFASSASALLATRRLSDNPKAAFRSVSGLILAIFVGSLIAVLVPAINAAQSPTNKDTLSSVLRVPYAQNSAGEGLPAVQTTALIDKLRTFAGTSVIPIYVNPAFLQFNQAQAEAVKEGKINVPSGGVINDNATAPNDSLISCEDLMNLSILGSCMSGTTAVSLNSADVLSGDNPLNIYHALPLVTHSNPSAQLDVHNVQLSGLLVKTNSPSSLERVRTYITTYNTAAHTGGEDGDGPDTLTAWQMGALEPETFGEVAAIRNNDVTNVERIVLAVVALTLITAGCSLAVTVGGSLVERKRPFTLLRVSGTPLSVLYKVILFEAVVPLIVVSVVAAGVGLGVAIPVVKALMKSLSPNTAYPVHPSVGYYIAVGAGSAIALIIVTLTLPLMKRITRPQDARFE